MMLILALALGSCGEGEVQRPTSNTDLGTKGDIYNYKHDGHDLIVWDGLRAGGMIHHPDCKKCRK